jgi:hypothetical protein
MFENPLDHGKFITGNPLYRLPNLFMAIQALDCEPIELLSALQAEPCIRRLFLNP